MTRHRKLPVMMLTAAAAAVTAGCGSSPSHVPAQTAGGPAAQAFAYSRCMRSHGVADFPDPRVTTTPGGGSVHIAMMAPRALADSPAFKTAEKACQRLLPGPGSARPDGHGPSKQVLLAFARCLRSHGLSGFPDPNAQASQSCCSSTRSTYRSAPARPRRATRPDGPAPSSLMQHKSSDTPHVAGFCCQAIWRGGCVNGVRDWGVRRSSACSVVLSSQSWSPAAPPLGSRERSSQIEDGRQECAENAEGGIDVEGDADGCGERFTPGSASAGGETPPATLLLALYSRGLSTRDIAAHVEEIYGVRVGRDLISKVTEGVMDGARA